MVKRPFIAVSGLPGAGKTTLAIKLAEALALPLLDKDDILESLFETAGEVDKIVRQRLSRASDDVLERLAAASRGAVIVSFWRHPEVEQTSGTPVAWLKKLSATVVEVHCICPPDVAEQRFRARLRHLGHNDALRSHSLSAQLRHLAELGPLGLGPCVSVRTDQAYDLVSIVRCIRRHID